MIPQNIIAVLLLLIIAPTNILALSSSSVTSSTQQKTIRIGTRPSPLAKIQANAVANALQKILHSSNDDTMIEIIEISSTGDQSQSSTSRTSSKSASPSSTSSNIQAQPLAVQSVDFTGTLDHALLNNEIDIAVHSLKDIPPSDRWRNGIEIASCLEREDPLDVLVVPKKKDGTGDPLCTSIQNLRKGARIGTSSVRRQAQLSHLRKDLELVNLRGNVGSRLNALEDGTVDALLLASAGLNRLIASTNTGIDTNTKRQAFYPSLCWSDIPAEELLSGACQGIVASTCRSTDSTTLNLLREIDHCDSSIAAAAERAFLDGLDSFRPSFYEGSPEWIGRPPLAALLRREVIVNTSASVSTVGEVGWIFQGILARPDGSRVLKTLEKVAGVLSIEDANILGKDQAKKLLLEAGSDFYQL